MAVALRQDYRKAQDEQNKEVQNLVLAGLEQIREGNTQNFDSVCDRLEKKYKNEAIQTKTTRFIML